MNNRDELLLQVARAQIKESILPEYQDGTATSEGLGIAIAWFFDWEGIGILETFYAALEEANYHSLNLVVAEWIKAEAEWIKAEGGTVEGEGE